VNIANKTRPEEDQLLLVGVALILEKVSIDVAENPCAIWIIFADTADPAASNASFTEAGVAAVVVEVELVESVRVVTP
jgi:hypothetical protein